MQAADINKNKKSSERSNATALLVGDRERPRNANTDNKRYCFNCRKDHLLKDCRVRCLRPECANKPTHTGSECKVRGLNNNRNKWNGRNRNRRQAPRRNGGYNRPTGGVIRNRGYAKATAKLARASKPTAMDEVEDAWIGMAIDPDTNLTDLPPLVPMTRARTEINEPATLEKTSRKKRDMGEKVQQAQAKKAKVGDYNFDPNRKLKKCAHMAINGTCAFYDCPLVLMDDDDDAAKGNECTQQRDMFSKPSEINVTYATDPYGNVMDGAVQRETNRETSVEWKVAIETIVQQLSERTDLSSSQVSVLMLFLSCIVASRRRDKDIECEGAYYYQHLEENLPPPPRGLDIDELHFVGLVVDDDEEAAKRSDSEDDLRFELPVSSPTILMNAMTAPTTTTTATETSSASPTVGTQEESKGAERESDSNTEQVENAIVAIGAITPHMDFLSMSFTRPEEIPWDSLTREQKIDENDYRSKLNVWVFIRKLHRRTTDPFGFPVPPRHWPPSWRLGAPTNYIVPREEPWYPSDDVVKGIPSLAWLPHFTTPHSSVSIEHKMTPVGRPVGEASGRPSTRLSVQFPLNLLDREGPIITTRPTSHPIIPDGPWLWVIDVHFAFRHATIMELEYWSLRLGFNILPADWQTLVGRCQYCGPFQPPGIYPADLPHS